METKTFIIKSLKLIAIILLLSTLLVLAIKKYGFGAAASRAEGGLWQGTTTITTIWPYR